MQFDLVLTLELCSKVSICLGPIVVMQFLEPQKREGCCSTNNIKSVLAKFDYTLPRVFTIWEFYGYDKFYGYDTIFMDMTEQKEVEA